MNTLTMKNIHECRFHPVALRVKAILDSGELGPVKSIDVKMKVPQGLLGDDDIRFLYSLGGGAMMDMGCMILALFFLTLYTDILTTTSSLHS
jgi:predicted dehydrogenase